MEVGVVVEGEEEIHGEFALEAVVLNDEKDGDDIH